jgi:5-deoxy-glucuronate isomerase
MGKYMVSSVRPDTQGKVLDVTPESAGWTYIGFQVYHLEKGQVLREDTRDQEVCIVLLGGKANVSTKLEKWEQIGERMSVFEKTPPYSVYIPNDDFYEVEAVTNLQIAVCLAPGKGTLPARLIAPQDVEIVRRGAGNIGRSAHNILPENKLADSLLVVEVFTPEGNWSSYPPHKHDEDKLPEMAYLEETYYHLMNKEGAFAIQRIYTDDKSLNETMIVKNGDLVIVPKGYHPVSAPPGYELYYLNIMAGPHRVWKFHNDPDHEWVMNHKLAQEN